MNGYYASLLFIILIPQSYSVMNIKRDGFVFITDLILILREIISSFFIVLVQFCVVMENSSTSSRRLS